MGKILIISQLLLFSIRRIFICHDYFLGDIGLILLGEKLTFTDKIQPIAPPDYGDVTVPTGDVCFISGWGSTLNASDSNEYLRGVNVPIVDHERCRRAYADLDFLIFHRDVCAGYFEGGKGGG